MGFYYMSTLKAEGLGAVEASPAYQSFLHSYTEKLDRLRSTDAREVTPFAELVLVVVPVRPPQGGLP